MCQGVRWGFVVAGPEISIHGPSFSCTQSSSLPNEENRGFRASPVCLDPGILCLLPVLTVQDALPSPDPQ